MEGATYLPSQRCSEQGSQKLAGGSQTPGTLDITEHRVAMPPAAVPSLLRVI